MQPHDPDRPAESPPGPDTPSAYLRAALAWLPIGVLMISDEGIIVLANHQLENLFGYTNAELIGRSFDVLISDSSRALPAALRKGGKPLQRHAAPATRGIFGRRKDGSEIAVDIVVAPFRFDNRNFTLASVVDISTPRRQDGDRVDLRDEPLGLEPVIRELGVDLINVRLDDIDRAIDDALARVVRAFGLDYGTVLELVEESGDFLHSYQWSGPGAPSSLPRVSAVQHFPWHLARIRAGAHITFATLDEVPDVADRESLRRQGTKSGVTIPLIIAGRTWGALTVGTLRQPRTWSPDVVNSLRIVARLLTNVIDRKHREEGVRRSVVGTLHQLRHENTYLRRELEKFSGTATIVGHSTAMRHVLDQVFQVAGTDLSVLITGEPGTGKRLLAARIHEQSPRRDRAMVRLHCASLSPDWIERELLGIEHGPGESRKTGRLEFANGSTVLLDEIGDLPLDAQTNLMRLQEGRLQLPGRSSAVSMDLRLIASTRKDLNDLVARGEFRADLFARLNVFPIHVPALRERREDIPLLVWRFVDEFAEAFNTPVDTIDTESMTALQQYEWRGNARELRNVIERAMIVAPSRHLRIPLPEGDTGSTSSIDNVSIEHITSMLALCGGRVHGKDGAAARLGLSPRALEAKMVTLGLRRP